MSTNALISYTENGRVRSVYIHWDGNPAETGKKLCKFFPTMLDAKALVQGGNLSQINEDGVPVYEFDIESSKDEYTYNVECDAEKGLIIEVEKEVDKNNPVFNSEAQISVDQARETALKIHPGKVVSEEREIGMDGSFTYEFDIQTKNGFEIKVDVAAKTGEIEEANIELYEIGVEKE